MLRKLAVVTAAVLVATMMVVTATSAQARTNTNTRAGITIKTPHNLTAYNGNKVTVRPSVHVRPGLKRSVISSVAYAYKGKKRVATGKTVRLAAGSYLVLVKVRYRNYRYVTKSRTVKTWHAGDMPDGSTCVVTATDDDGYWVAAADCTNPAFPGTVHDTDVLTDEDAPFTVGETVHSDYVTFPGYYSSRTQHYQVKSWVGGYHYVSSPKRAVVVKDGGRRRVFSDNQSLTTNYFSVPQHWTASYSYNCGSMTGNWILSLHKSGTSVLYDNQLSNVIRHSGAGTYHFSGSGKYRFDVITECDWTIVVRSR